MKITNRQLRILAEDLHKNHFKPVYDKELQTYNENKESIELTEEEKKVCQDLVESYKAFNVAYRNAGSTYSYRTSTDIKSFENVLLNMKKTQLKFNTAVPTVDQIESDLLLSILDAKDLNQLMEAIKTKYNLS